MTLAQALYLFIYPATVGMVLGFFYFGSLWLILRRISQLRHPEVWVALSLVVRLLAVLFVMYLLFADSWQQLLSTVVGMLVSRGLLVHRIKPEKTRHVEKHKGPHDDLQSG